MTTTRPTAALLPFLPGALLAFASCGYLIPDLDNSFDPSTPVGIVFSLATVQGSPANSASNANGPFTVGGTVSGLAGGVLELQNNGGDDLTLTSAGAFTFRAPLAAGATYAVSVKSQPTSPNVTQRCIVQNGAGTLAGANVTDVSVTCASAVVYIASSNLTWMRCAAGQVWNSAADNCTAAGSAPEYGALKLRYCNAANDSCNGGAPAGALDGGGTSEAWSTCDALVLAGRSDWRMPTKEELNSIVSCSKGPGPQPPLSSCNAGSASPAVNASLFPNLPGNDFWTSGSNSSVFAHYVTFIDGDVLTAFKDWQLFVRCVADGP